VKKNIGGREPVWKTGGRTLPGPEDLKERRNCAEQGKGGGRKPGGEKISFLKAAETREKGKVGAPTHIV